MRRALNMHATSKMIVESYQGILPSDERVLLSFPGIGPGTVGALRAYAFNVPHPFIETNIRSVFIYEFFKNKKTVHDKDILSLVEKTLDEKNPREWFYALTDYGVFLKKQVDNPSKASVHYTKQSKFEGSNRQKRSRILTTLLENKFLNKQELVKATNLSPKEIQNPLKELIKENFISQKNGKYFISS